MSENLLQVHEYETIYVINPTLDDKKAQEFMLTLKDLVASEGGKNIKVACMGRRRLAWERIKQTRGIFVNHNYVGPSGIVKKIERVLGLDENIMQRQSVVVAKHVDIESYEEKEDETDASKIVVETPQYAKPDDRNAMPYRNGPSSERKRDY